MEQMYLNEKQVAQMTAIPLSTLRNNRSTGKGLPYVKIGRCVRYSKDDVVAFMEEHKVTHTAKQ